MTAQKTHRFKRFIDKRIPLKTRMVLDHSRLFIVPTAFGFGLLLLIILLFVLGTNYQNNPILIVSYLLFTWLVTAMYKCFFNLNGASITLNTLPDTHQNQGYIAGCHLHSKRPRFAWHFHRANSHRFSGKIKASNKQDDTGFVTDLTPDQTFHIPLIAVQRGEQHIGDIRLESRFPFGLFRCWTFLRYAKKHWVYPAPISEHWSLQHFTDKRIGQDNQEQIADAKQTKKTISEPEFDDLKTYRPGESLARVSWKHQAKNPNADWLVKHYQQPSLEQRWLTFASIHKSSLEHQLSVLTFATVELSNQNSEFGLALIYPPFAPIIIQPSSGIDHKNACLQGLARFGLVANE
jgi:uncharacterized protein (DUF58 family)